MTNQVIADPHPAVEVLPTPPSSLGPPRGLALVCVLKVDGTHMSWLETPVFFGASHFTSLVGKKKKLAPFCCLCTSDFITTGHNRTEPS